MLCKFSPNWPFAQILITGHTVLLLVEDAYKTSSIASFFLDITDIEMTTPTNQGSWMSFDDTFLTVITVNTSESGLSVELARREGG